MIKILTRNDLSQFKQLINDVQLIETNPNHYEVELTPEDIDALFHPDNQASAVLLGAFDADTLVGFIQLNYNSQLTKRIKQSLNIYMWYLNIEMKG